MSLNSVLKPPEAVSIGLAEAAAVYVIYSSMLPNHADITSAPAHDATIEAGRKKAAWTSAALLGFVFLITQDLNSLWIGGLALTGIDLMTKHSNGVNPATGKLAAAPGSSITGQAMEPAGGNDTAFPLADYADPAQPDLSYDQSY
jgi:hypothetical protein